MAIAHDGGPPKSRLGCEPGRRRGLCGRSDGILNWHCLLGIRTVHNETDVNLELKPLIYTREQVARVLQVPPGTIEDLHRTGQLTGFKVGRHLRWWPEHVREFAEQLAQKVRG